MKLTVNAKNIFIEVVTYLFILLFLYTGGMKTISRLDFYYGIRESHLLYNYAGFISWSIPIIELATVACLTIPKLKRIGLYSSFILMALFTIYVGYNVFFLTHQQRPCTCGGIIQKMSWNQHVVFNTVFTLLALLAIRFDKQKTKALAEYTETRNLSLS
jgi:hypothetical protein